ncbi:MAG TPA: alpha/beta fold hydrolase [Solirubrobacteraceae bacterium]|nr:alpha/beta fold hydrolase [Solirubrobacteraceae bacterium]
MTGVASLPAAAHGLWPAVMCAGLSFRQWWIEVDGVATRCLEAGSPDAPPVVFLHGVGGHLEAFHRNLAVHAARYRVVAYDLPGHGLSTFDPGRSYEIDGYVRHLEALLDALDISSVALSGLSLGGWIAARFAASRTDRVAALVLNGTGGATFDERVMADIKRLSSAATTTPDGDAVTARLRWLMADPASVSVDLVEARRVIYAQPHMGAAMRRILCLQEPAVRRRNLIAPEEWAAIAAPTLIIWGDRDPTGLPAIAHGIAEGIPDARVEVLADCGHWAQFERADRFNALQLEFLGAAYPS